MLDIIGLIILIAVLSYVGNKILRFICEQLTTWQ